MKALQPISGPQIRQLQWLAYCNAFIAFYCFLPRFFVMPAASGLDNSWMLSLNMAIDNGLIFGKDIGFTYGPLGWLSYRTVPIIYHEYWLLVYDFILVTMVSWSFYTLTKASSHGIIAGLITLSIIMMGLHPAMMVFTHSWVIIFLCVRLLMGKAKPWEMAPLIILTTTSLFIKGNVALPLTFAFLCAIIVQPLTFKNFLFKAMVPLVLYVIVAGLACYLLNVDLLPYIKINLAIVDGYNDGMSYILDGAKFKYGLANAILWFGITAMLFTYICYADYKNRTFNIRKVIGLSLVIMLAFLAYKQSFTRYFSNDNVFFASIGGVAILLLYVISLQVKAKIPVLFLLASILITLLTVNNVERLQTIVRPPYSLAFSKGSLEGINGYQIESNSLPLDVIKELQTGTVDIMPYDASYIYFNNLKYKPRPIFASYKPYTTYLDSLNVKHFANGKGANFLLISAGSVDGRHPFWDESLTKLEILKRYHFQKRTLNVHPSIDLINNHGMKDTLLLLSARKEMPSDFGFSFSKEITSALGTAISIPANNDKQILYIKPDIKYNSVGKMLKVMLQPPKLYAKIEYLDGTFSTHRAILPIVNSGVLISHKMLDNNHLTSFYSRQFSSLIKVKSIAFFSNEKGFEKEYKLKFISVTVN